MISREVSRWGMGMGIVYSMCTTGLCLARRHLGRAATADVSRARAPMPTSQADLTCDTRAARIPELPPPEDQCESNRKRTREPWAKKRGRAATRKKPTILPHLLLDRSAPDLLDALHAGPHVGLHPPPPLVVRAARRLAAADAAPPRGLFSCQSREAVLEHGHLALGLAAPRSSRPPRASGGRGPVRPGRPEGRRRRRRRPFERCWPH